MNTTERTRVLLAAAIPGPWTRDERYVVAEVPGGRPGGEVIIKCEPSVWRLHDVVPRDEHAALIVHLRNTAGVRCALEDAVRELLRHTGYPEEPSVTPWMGAVARLFHSIEALDAVETP